MIGTIPALERLDTLIEVKRTNLIAYKDKPSPKSLNALRSARNGLQKEVCINDY